MSNCPLAVLWLWLAGRAETIVASKSDISGWRWHFGGVRGGLVYHFKRTRIVKRQPWAPFYFEGRMQVAELETVRRSKSFLWQRHPAYVVPGLALLVAAGLVPWMLVSAFYWPCWLLAGAWQAWRCNRATDREYVPPEWRQGLKQDNRR